MSYKTFSEYRKEDNQEEVLWSDRKRILGMPLTFTKYTLTDERLITKIGFLNTEMHELLLYRIMDIEMRQSFSQRIFGVGTIIVHASDRTSPIMELANIKKPSDLKRYLSRLVETIREEKQITGKEMFGAAASYSTIPADRDGDGIPDYLQVDRDGDGIPDYSQNPVYKDTSTGSDTGENQ